MADPEFVYNSDTFHGSGILSIFFYSNKYLQKPNKFWRNVLSVNVLWFSDFQKCMKVTRYKLQGSERDLQMIVVTIHLVQISTSILVTTKSPSSPGIF